MRRKERASRIRHVIERNANPVIASHADIDRLLDVIVTKAEEHRVFMYAVEAVKDMQGTIRAIDTKAGILLAAMAIPLPFLERLLGGFSRQGQPPSLHVVLAWCAFFAWILAALVAIRTLTGIGNASQHLGEDAQRENTFYAGGLFRLRWIDALLNRRSIRSLRSLDNHVAAIPRSAEEMLQDLGHEMLALAYIRDVKIHRQKIAFDLIASAVVLALAAYLV